MNNILFVSILVALTGVAHADPVCHLTISQAEQSSSGTGTGTSSDSEVVNQTISLKYDPTNQEEGGDTVFHIARFQDLSISRGSHFGEGPASFDVLALNSANDSAESLASISASEASNVDQNTGLTRIIFNHAGKNYLMFCE